mmetsp:Transcript_138328/g.240503  ORF Transcript_138328/g.240503 Transcript_138328/m.240503 type:complete len:256 (+) Transcript_138328:1933-2700(+)
MLHMLPLRHAIVAHMPSHLLPTPRWCWLHVCGTAVQSLAACAVRSQACKAMPYQTSHAHLLGYVQYPHQWMPQHPGEWPRSASSVHWHPRSRAPMPTVHIAHPHPVWMRGYMEWVKVGLCSMGVPHTFFSTHHPCRYLSLQATLGPCWPLGCFPSHPSNAAAVYLQLLVVLDACKSPPPPFFFSEIWDHAAITCFQKNGMEKPLAPLQFWNWMTRICSWARSNWFQPSQVLRCICTEGVAGMGTIRGIQNRLGGC